MREAHSLTKSGANTHRAEQGRRGRAGQGHGRGAAGQDEISGAERGKGRAGQGRANGAGLLTVYVCHPDGFAYISF